ncbi:hypothetical protein [Acinetobacter nosocomialis]|uniref:hypothetical protein n=1 Tax=Acinetobacter nosocomialis TaxID=106654 RepID=UPI0033B4E0B3
MPKYQVRVKEEPTEQDLVLQETANEIFGVTVVSRTVTYITREVADVQEVLNGLKEVEIELKDVLSIIAIDPDNEQLLGEDFDWEGV